MNKAIFEQAQNLWQNGKELEAIAILKPLVVQGNTEAKAYLGIYLMSYHEENKFPYLNEGITFLQEACNEGNPSAAHNLGSIYLTGTPFIKKDRKKAAEFYLKARELEQKLGLPPVVGPEFYKEWEQEVKKKTVTAEGTGKADE
jgi:TPR repeat protein